MNVNAIYNVTANIQDLDPSLTNESSRRNTPVNCVLKLDGVLRNPTISFDLELPSSNEELQRQVKSLVDTEDMMTRQIIYLLVLNKFYTPEYNAQYKSNDFSAVASSALSSQISSSISTSVSSIPSWLVRIFVPSCTLSVKLFMILDIWEENSTINNQKNAFIGEYEAVV